MVENRLSTKLGDIVLSNPVITASGTCGYGKELNEWFDLNILGGFSIKGTTLNPREGNPSPRIAECPMGLINSVGLQNPGIDRVLSEEVPQLRKQYMGRILANISGFSIEEYKICAEKIAELENTSRHSNIDILEVNISCPNVHNGGMAFGTSAQAAAEVTKAVKSVSKIPVYLKLSPNVTDIVSIAKACADAGADGVCLINTVSAMRIDTVRRQPIVANKIGGFSGPAVFPIAVRMIWQVANALPGFPIIGCGGVETASDVIEMMMAGASAVEVGSATLKNPLATKEIVENLPAEMDRLKINRLEEIIACVHY